MANMIAKFGRPNHMPLNSPLSRSRKMLADSMQNSDTQFRVLTENFAKMDMTATSPGGDPPRRKMVIYEPYHDRHTNSNSVRIKKIAEDMSDFPKEYSPGHPAADQDGYVKRSNVERIIEISDMMRLTQHRKAVLNAYKFASKFEHQQIDLLK